jgi:Uma2 family endonuclease
MTLRTAMQQPVSAATGTAAPVAEAPDVPRPPNAADLPYSDGMPMESDRHVAQMTLLVRSLRRFWRDRDDVYVAGNMFVYFSEEQVLNQDFRGPDVFAVTGVHAGERKSWVVWVETKPPDVVIELLSESTRREDTVTKKEVYRDKLRVPEYFWYDPFSGEWAGWVLVNGRYEPVTPDAHGALPSVQLGLRLVRWQGVYDGIEALWLRWATPDGTLLPTDTEDAEQAEQRADEAEQRADEAEQRADEAEQRADDAENRAAALQAELEEYRRRYGGPGPGPVQ